MDSAVLRCSRSHESQIDREGKLSVREWEWEIGIDNVGVAPPVMEGESPINTTNISTSEPSPTVMHSLTKDGQSEKIPQKKSQEK